MIVFRLSVVFIAVFVLAADLHADDELTTGDDCGRSEAAKANGEKPHAPSVADVVLIDAGEEPRRELRYRADVGDVQQAMVQHQLSAVQRVAGFVTPRTYEPKITAIVQTEVQKKDADLITIRVRFQDASAVPDPDAERAGGAGLANVVNQMQALQRRTVNITMNERGIVRSFELDQAMNPSSSGLLIDSAPELLLNTIRRAVVPLPADAVGVGARWRIVKSWKEGGVTPERETEYRIEAIDGDTVEISVRVNAWAEPQEVSAPGARELELMTYAAREVGKSVFSEGSILPKQFSRRTTVDTEFEVNLHAMSQQVEATSSVGPVPEPERPQPDEARSIESPEE